MDKSTNTITPRRRREWKIEDVNKIDDGCKPFEVFNEDWAVNADGDLIGWGYYFIDCNRLAEEDWFIHMMSKVQFDASTFMPAYIEACKRANIQKVTMKMFY